MKAIIQSKYGGPEVYTLQDIAKPEPKPNEVLIKVHATAINDYDWSLMSGKPYVYRLMFGLFKPKNKIPGMELSGVIKACGDKADKFKAGDPVYGDISEYGFGSFAEYICVNEKALTLKPESMTHEEASSLSHAAMLAHQGLFDIGHIQQGQKILINGAGGGVGTFALYLAKQFNAEVTGVDTGDKLETMQSIGYDHIIDYKKESFTDNGHQYDLILDAKTSLSPLKYLDSLTEGGRYVTVGGQLSRLLQTLLCKPFIAKMSNKSVHIVALKTNKDLDYIHGLYSSRKLKTQLEIRHGLAAIPDAIQYFGEGKHTGKVVISLT